MNLLEYQAKEILRRAQVPVPPSYLYSNDLDPLDVDYPVIAKSQVPVGGRGKLGGIVAIDEPGDLVPTVDQLLSLQIKGHLPTEVFLEKAVEIKRELYLALRVNRDTAQIEYLAAEKGGVDIEQNAENVVTVVINAPTKLEQIAKALKVREKPLAQLLKQLENCFYENDLLLCEINPLVLTPDGKMLCADAKCLVDDNARFRQQTLPWSEKQQFELRELGGNIGCIANGAGMAMSTMDTVVASGGKPANFLDIGGGTGEEGFIHALGIVNNLGVGAIVINIFAGISRCDEIARGIVAASQRIDGLAPLFIRLEGTNRDEGIQILNQAGIAVENSLADCVKKALRTTK